MLKLEVKDNFVNAKMDGTQEQITADLLLGLVQLFMFFERNSPGSGHLFLHAISYAIASNCIAESAEMEANCEND